MRTRTTIASLSTVLAISALALSACGGDDEPDTKDTETSQQTESTESTESAAPTESTETTESAETEAAPAGDVTAPGTELSIGDAATVPYESGTDGSGVVEVKITGIDKGSAADLKPLDLGDRAKGYLPYYIQVEVTGVSGSASLAHGSLDEAIEGTLPDGSEAQTIYVIGDFAPCNGETFPGDFADGSTFTTCVPYLAQESTEVSGAQFAANDSDYDSYDGEPIVWK